MAGSVNADIDAFYDLRAARMGISVGCMDSTEYAAAVADKTHKAITDAGESINSVAKKTGTARSTLDRKFNAGKGIQSLTVRELHGIAELVGTTPTELMKVYKTDAEQASA